MNEHCLTSLASVGNADAAFTATRVPVLAAAEQGILPAWLELARSAIEPNPFYEPDYLMALDRYILQRDVHELVLIWTEGAEPQLVGLFPIAVQGLRRGYAKPAVRFLFDDLLGISTPLIASERPEQVWACFFSFILNQADLPDMVHIKEFYPHEPAGRALAGLVKAGKIFCRVESEFERAAVVSELDYHGYTAAWSRKKLRSQRSRSKRLEALGELSFDIFCQTDPEYKGLLDKILALEAAGWKGRRGTAINCSKDTRQFAEMAFCSPSSAPACHIAVLRLDGKLIAGQVNLVSRDHVFFFKSAYDEAYGRYGVGFILYFWMLEQMLDHKRYCEFDSCANADHPLETFWQERKTVQSVFLTARGGGHKRAVERVIEMRGHIDQLVRLMKNSKEALGRLGARSDG